MSLIDDTCDGCGSRFDPMGDPLLQRDPTPGDPWRVLCETCVEALGVERPGGLE